MILCYNLIFDKDLLCWVTPYPYPWNKRNAYLCSKAVSFVLFFATCFSHLLNKISDSKKCRGKDKGVPSGNFIDITIKEKSREGGTGNKQKRSKGMVDTGGKENRRERKDEKRQQDPVVKMKVEGRRISH